jgi:serine protease AprX
MPITAVDQALIDAARKRIGDLFGKALAEKASAAFCLKHGAPSVKHPLTFEALAPAPGNAVERVIVELAQPPLVHAQARLAALKSGALEELGDLLQRIGATSAHGGALSPLRVLRQEFIRSQRDDFFRRARTVGAELERRVQRLVGFGAESISMLGGVRTEMCWLNGTMRASVRPHDLADLAADPDIDRIGVPRGLVLENELGTAVGAPVYRQKMNRSGKGIIVAVIDTEAAMHSAFQDRLIHKQNYTSEPWGHPHSHGTAVAGIIGARAAEFSGIAPDVTLYHYKVIATQKREGDDFGGSMAIQQALEDGADIANCSWGAGPAGDGTSREARACDAAWRAGLTIVKSAGNRGPAPGTLTSPADAEGVIVVGATDNDGLALQDYSSRGPAQDKHRPHLIAPGGKHGAGIWSCTVEGMFADCGMGTSFAAPHVAGLLALTLEGSPHLESDALRDLLVGACRTFGHEVDTYGAGLVDFARLL